MKVLVIGNGGREHALAWRLTQSPQVEKVFVAPGNGGTASAPRMQNLALTDIEDLIAFARREAIAYTLVGPEAPLAAGIVDRFRAEGLKIFGPSQAAARLESSKDHAKAFMMRHGIPTARYRTVSDIGQAKAHVRAQGAPIVIKADGLAAGKGVIVAMTEAEALRAIDHMLGDHALGGAGARLVIEECLEGEEASFIVMCDGSTILPLASSQDHKRLRDGDQGPNTGGMGAYSPAPLISPVLHQRVMREVIVPTIHGMRDDGIPYTGFLYAGLMIGPGPDEERSIKVLEYNCRMGDPEAQPIVMRVASDFAELMQHAVDGTLDQAELEWDPRPALGVVMAAPGYPEQARCGDPIIHLPPNSTDCVVFQAGTEVRDGVLRTSGGRVLCVTALGDSLKAAQDRAYQVIRDTGFPGAQYRSDIGWRAMEISS